MTGLKHELFMADDLGLRSEAGSKGGKNQDGAAVSGSDQGENFPGNLTRKVNRRFAARLMARLTKL
ncbi:MAG: hypothetical protein V1816_16585 [Pseudomonadota bacterium]